MKRYAKFILSVAMSVILLLLVLWAPSIFPAAQRLRLLISSELHSEESRTVAERRLSNDWLVYDVKLHFWGGVTDDIKPDASGQMWVTNAGRLLRFDGKQWYDCKSEVIASLPGQIRGLGIAEERVYVGLSSGSTDGGIAVYDTITGRWSAFWPDQSELSEGGVRGIAVDSLGRGYLPTWPGILDIFDGKQWEHRDIPVPERDGLLINYDSEFDREGNYWLATGYGVWKYNGHDWQVYPMADQVNALAVDAKGRVWAATGSGLAVLDVDGAWYLYTANDSPLNTNWISDVAVDAADRVWATTRDALYVFNGMEWQVFDPEVAGAARWADAVAIDDSGRAWVATTDTGIAVFEGLVNIEPLERLVSPPPMEILPDIELVPPYLPKHNDEMVEQYLRYVMIVLIFVATVVQVVRSVRDFRKSKEDERIVVERQRT